MTRPFAFNSSLRVPKHPLNRGGGGTMKRSKIRARSAKQSAKEAAWSRVRRQKKHDTGGACERCGHIGSHCHHRLPRSQGGPDVYTNAAWMCIECHKHVHEHPAESYAAGWLRKAWEANQTEECA